jgi:inorganic pyrophosphatase
MKNNDDTNQKESLATLRRSKSSGQAQAACYGEKTFQAFRPHPWHGLEAGDNVPDVVNAFVEITPFDLVKYEVDKVSGYLRVDRPQRTSSQPPALYGFIPRTLCAERVRELSPGACQGDGDPLDICIISERPITKSEVIVRARPIGGLQMNDGGEADDKIIAVLHNDHVWGKVRELHDLPSVLLERLRHYFETYKIIPGRKPTTEIRTAYGKTHAGKVIEAAIQDYNYAFRATERLKESGTPQVKTSRKDKPRWDRNTSARQKTFATS